MGFNYLIDYKEGKQIKEEFEKKKKELRMAKLKERVKSDDIGKLYEDKLMEKSKAETGSFFGKTTEQIFQDKLRKVG